MRHFVLLSGFVLLAFTNLIKAEDEIDSYVSTRCESECNGESTACRDCYSRAVDLFDQPQSMSSESNPKDAVAADDLDINPHMGLEVPF